MAVSNVHLVGKGQNLKINPEYSTNSSENIRSMLIFLQIWLTPADFRCFGRLQAAKQQKV